MQVDDGHGEMSQHHMFGDHDEEEEEEEEDGGVNGEGSLRENRVFLV